METGLKKELGFLDVFSIASGAMISSGLFVLPGIIYLRVGPGVFLCYLLASLLLLPALFAKMELATALPKAGGDYFFIDRSIGPLFGTLGGVAAWASLAFKTAFALIGIGAIARSLWPSLGEGGIKLVALGGCVFFALVNLWGARHAGRLQVVLVFVLLALLAAYSVGGLSRVEPAHFAERWPPPVSSLFVGAAMAFVSFGGLTKAASVAEEVKNPGRNLTLGMLAAYVVVSLVYVAVVLATVGLVPPDELSGSLTPVAQGGEAMWSKVGWVLMTVAALLAFVSTANAGILAASRTPLAMSRDGLLPPALGHIWSRRGTPHNAVIFTAVFIGAVLFLDLELFVKSASAMKILLFTFTILSLFLLRESKIENYQPQFRVPLYPWLYGLGVLAYLFLLVELGSLPLLVACGVLGGGLVWYGAYVRRRVVRESALTHLARRIASRDLPSHDLEAELAEIVHERDGGAEDEFDRLVRGCVVLDLPGGINRDEFFRLVAGELAPRLELSPEEIEGKLREREAVSSTVIRPGLAIPHVVVEGEGHFELLLARSREGIELSEGAGPVHAFFVLIGSADRRNMHLRSLTAVAEVAQGYHFDRRWRRARDAEALRGLVLHSKRRRFPEHKPSQGSQAD